MLTALQQIGTLNSEQDFAGIEQESGNVGCCLQVEPKVQKLYDYIRERGTILPINDYNEDLLSQDDVHKRVIESIRSGKLSALACNVSLRGRRFCAKQFICFLGHGR